MDRIASQFVPNHRYRCESFSCQWEGTLRPARHLSSKRYRIPVTFVACMVVCAVGFVAVVVTSLTLSLPNAERHLRYGPSDAQLVDAPVIKVDGSVEK